MTDLRVLAGQLEAVLSRLAAAPDSQLHYLNSFDVAVDVDELALELDDTLPPVRGKWVDMPPDLKRALDALSSHLDMMSADAELWTEDALRSSHSWRRIREVAGSALQELRSAVFD